MLNPEELKRYNRHLIMPEIGAGGQEKIRNARILVVGAGGLGCPLLQYLAAAGVGTIGIVDPETVDESNLQRQVLFTTDDIGKYKAEVASRKLNSLNPHIQLRSYVDRLTPENALEMMRGYDLVMDGSDNFATRYLVNDACVMLGKPFVSGSVYKFEGQLSVFNYQQGPTYRCLYPEPGNTPSCSEVGVLGTLTGIIGCMMSSEAIKIITGAGEVLSGKLLVLNMLNMQFQTFGFRADPVNTKITELRDYDAFCAGGVNELAADELKEMMKSGEDFQLIDVREPAEYAARNIGGVLIPLNEFHSNLFKIAKDKKVVVHCQGGARSRKAIELLKAEGFTNVYNLKNGLSDF